MAEVQAAVECTTRIPPSRQALMVCEERRRSDGLSSNLGTQLQQFARQLGSREEAYKMVLGCTKFVLLSEALNRWELPVSIEDGVAVTSTANMCAGAALHAGSCPALSTRMCSWLHPSCCRTD